MKILLFCPSFPPKICGVGDYSFYLAEALYDLDSQVAVATFQADAQVWRKKKPYILKTISDLSHLDAEVLIFQYTPYLYFRHPSALTLEFERTLRDLKAARPAIKIGIQFHESYYPVLPTLAGMIYGLPQWLHFKALANQCDFVSFTFEKAWQDFVRQFPHHQEKALWLPVGSNIPVNSGSSKPVDDQTLRLTRFGGMHPTQPLEPCLNLIRELKRSKSVHLDLVGLTEAPVPDMDLRENLKFHGFLSASEISNLLSQSQACLAPFLDGVSTRRGSVMAALAHGVPVLTNLGRNSVGTVPWAEFTGAADTLEDFVQRSAALLSTDLNPLGQKGKSYYSNHFAWPKIAGAIYDFLQKTMRTS